MKKLHAVVIARKSLAKVANVAIVVAKDAMKGARTKAGGAAKTAVTVTTKAAIVQSLNA